METTTRSKAKVLKPSDGKAGFLGSIGVRFMIDGDETDGGFSLVEHPMSPRALAAPLHRHNREDEYTYVLEGKVGALLGDDVLVAEPGDLVWKPRNQWHTFWNAGDTPARILEIIAPAGFERFFEELSDMGGALGAPPEDLAALRGRYGLEMQPDSVPGLLERFDLVMGEELQGGWTLTAARRARPEARSPRTTCRAVRGARCRPGRTRSAGGQTVITASCPASVSCWRQARAVSRSSKSRTTSQSS